MVRKMTVAFLAIALVAAVATAQPSSWRSTNHPAIDYRFSTGYAAIAVDLRNRTSHSIRVKYSIWIQGEDSPTKGVSTWIPRQDSRVIEGTIVGTRPVERVEVEIIEEAK